VVLDGGAVWTESGTNSGKVGVSTLISNSGELRLDKGTILRNNDVFDIGAVGGLIQSWGNLVIDGASLYGGRAATGGALFSDGGVLNLKSGSIYENQGMSDAGGALYLRRSSTIMEDGFEIHDNILYGEGGVEQAVGGAVYIQNQASTFEMRGGKMYGNTAGTTTRPGYGGAIGMNGGEITISGGEIYDNKASDWGGAIYYGAYSSAYGDSTFTMTGGIIRNNTARVAEGTRYRNYGGAIFAYNMLGTRFHVFTNILGGTITGNKSDSQGLSDAIYASCILRLSDEAVVNGTIFLPQRGTYRPTNVTISLISMSPSTSTTYTCATDPIFDSANGRVVVEPGSFDYNDVTHELTDAEPYVDRFSHITKGVITGSSSEVPSPSGTLVLGALPPEYSITVETDGNGTAAASASVAQAGKKILLTATPSTGYQFKEWQVVSANVNIDDDTFVMPADDVTIKAIFEKKVVPGNIPETPDDSTPTIPVKLPVTTDDRGSVKAPPLDGLRPVDINKKSGDFTALWGLGLLLLGAVVLLVLRRNMQSDTVQTTCSATTEHD
jgi:hypothetical protein